MNLDIQKGESEHYRYCYFENEKGRFFADMTNDNGFIGILVPLPRLHPVLIRIYECNEQWEFNENNPLKSKRGIHFDDQELNRFVCQYFKQ